jgi:phosphopantetheinyl transferase
MVKEPKKPHKSPTNTINNILSENKNTPKSKQQIDQEYYQKNKERKKQQQQERYQQKKKQEQLLAQKLYQASNIKILLSLKEYTELNKEKHKL